MNIFIIVMIEKKEKKYIMNFQANLRIELIYI